MFRLLFNMILDSCIVVNDFPSLKLLKHISGVILAFDLLISWIFMYHMRSYGITISIGNTYLFSTFFSGRSLC